MTSDWIISFEGGTFRSVDADHVLTIVGTVITGGGVGGINVFSEIRNSDIIDGEIGLSIDGRIIGTIVKNAMVGSMAVETISIGSYIVAVIGEGGGVVGSVDVGLIILVRYIEDIIRFTLVVGRVAVGIIFM